MLTKNRLPFIAYFLLLAAYAIFSYSLTAPNLILSNWEPYWNFQQWMWANFFNNRELLSYVYVFLMVAIFGAFIWLILSLKKNGQIKWWHPLLLSAPLLLSNNALSYDVFNYIFNAKMVWYYHANPHVQTALEFAYDDWTRFMHNTHTPAPYFYGWTGISLIPYVAGGGKFLLTWLNFRLFSWLSLAGLSWLVIKEKKSTVLTGLLLFNPLLLIEVVSNFHNDLWMMLPALWAMLLVTKTKPSWWQYLSSVALLAFSISIKLASAALIPLWLVLVLPWPKILQVLEKWANDNWALLASLLMFLPLLTARSKQFLPWYLLWPLIWLPFIDKKWRFWKYLLVSFSFSSMLRYLPYLWAGNYDGLVPQQQISLTWLPMSLVSLVWVASFFYRKLAELAD